MKASLDRTKVVLRHLPPGISEATLVEQIDGAFAGRYNWLSFRLGKPSQKHQSYSRAYINFKSPDDVLGFAEFFNGHVFVNEKGSQFKTTVEYAPSQRVPKQLSKSDVREGTILKDPEYLEFIEFLSKPIENLPSAEIQLERREAERAGASKDVPIVTPLMDFVRLKRAAKSGSRRSMSKGKLSRRSGGLSGTIPNSVSSKRGSDKRRSSTAMYVQRDTSKSSSGKEKPTLNLVAKQDDQQLADKPLAAGIEVSEEESGISGIIDGGKKKVLLLKGKEREIHSISGSDAPLTKKMLGSAIKQNSQHEGSGKLIRSILLNKDARQSQSSAVHIEQQLQISSLEKDKRPPKPPNAYLALKETNSAPESTVVGGNWHGSYTGKQERRTRNKDKPDWGVWTLRRSNESYASDDSLSFSTSQLAHMSLDSSEGVHGDAKVDLFNARIGQVRTYGRGHNSSLENGFHKHGSRRVSVGDGSPVASEGKPFKKSSALGHSSHEKQVWVQKSSSGS